MIRPAASSPLRVPSRSRFGSELRHLLHESTEPEYNNYYKPTAQLYQRVTEHRSNAIKIIHLSEKNRCEGEYYKTNAIPKAFEEVPNRRRLLNGNVYRIGNSTLIESN